MSIEDAKAKLEQAERARYSTRQNPTMDDFRAARENALGLRMEAAVLAVEALIERLDGGRPKTCTMCHGTGYRAVPLDTNTPCGVCGGKGSL